MHASSWAARVAGLAMMMGAMALGGCDQTKIPPVPTLDTGAADGAQKQDAVQGEGTGGPDGAGSDAKPAPDAKDAAAEATPPADATVEATPPADATVEATPPADATAEATPPADATVEAMPPGDAPMAEATPPADAMADAQNPDGMAVKDGGPAPDSEPQATCADNDKIGVNDPNNPAIPMVAPGQAALDLYLCEPGDVDWFVITPASPGSYTVTVTYDVATALNVDLYLYDTQGQEVAHEWDIFGTGANTLTAELTDPAYGLRAEAYAGAGAYTLVVAEACKPGLGNIGGCPCAADAECVALCAPGDQKCSDLAACDVDACVQLGCKADADCAGSKDGVLCTPDNFCGCAADTDCPGAAYCDFEQCVEKECSVDADCADNPDGGKCLSDDWYCGCAVDADCAAASYCDFDGCVPYECTADAECAQSLAGAKCITDAWECGCMAPEDCGGPVNPFVSVCDDGLCGECLVDGDCAGNPDALGPICDGGLCSCFDDTDCAGSTWGAACGGMSVCGCASDADCTGGEVCKEQTHAWIAGFFGGPDQCQAP